MREFSSSVDFESGENEYRDPFFTSRHQPRPKVIVLSGGTAVGKTSTAIHIAKSLNGEIISADSVQIFSGIDIGSAKVGVEETDGVPHYLIDLCPVGSQDSNASQFYACALTLVNDIISRGKTPIVVGGTSMYTRWLQYGKPGEITTTHDPVLKSSIMRVFVDNCNHSKSALVAVVKREDVQQHEQDARKSACANIPRINQCMDSDWFALRSLLLDELSQAYSGAPRFLKQYSTSVDPLGSPEQPCFKTLLHSFKIEIPVDIVTYSGKVDLHTLLQESLLWKYNSPVLRNDHSRSEYCSFVNTLYSLFVEEQLQLHLERYVMWAHEQGVRTSVDWLLEQLPMEDHKSVFLSNNESSYRLLVREYIRNEPCPSSSSVCSFGDLFYPESNQVTESNHEAHSANVKVALEKYISGERGLSERPVGIVLYSVQHPSLPTEPVYMPVPLNPNEIVYIALSSVAVPTVPKPQQCTLPLSTCLGFQWKLTQLKLTPAVLAWTDSILFQNDLYRFEKRVLHVFTAPEGIEPQVPQQYNDKQDQELITRLQHNEGPAPLNLGDLCVSHAGRGLVHDFDVRVFFLCTNRNFHYRLADFRCEEMIRRGMLKETLLLTNTLSHGSMREQSVDRRGTLDFVHSTSLQEGLEAARQRVLPAYLSVYPDVVAQFAKDLAPTVRALLECAQSDVVEAQKAFSLLSHLRACLRENLCVAQSQQTSPAHNAGTRGMLRDSGVAEATDGLWSATALNSALECVSSLEQGLAVSLSVETVIQLACPSPLVYRTRVKRQGDATLYTENPAAYLSIHWFERSMVLRGCGLQSSRGDELGSREQNPLFYGSFMPRIVAETEVQEMLPHIRGDVALWLQIFMSVKGVRLSRQKCTYLQHRTVPANTINNVDIGQASPTMSLFLEGKAQLDRLPRSRETSSSEPVTSSLRVNKYVIGEKIKAIGDQYSLNKANRSLSQSGVFSHTTRSGTGANCSIIEGPSMNAGLSGVVKDLSVQSENLRLYAEHLQSKETTLTSVAASIVHNHERTMDTFPKSKEEFASKVLLPHTCSFTPVFATSGTNMIPNEAIALPKVPLKQQTFSSTVFSAQPLPFQTQEALPAFGLPTVLNVEQTHLSGFTARFPSFVPTNTLANSYNDGRQQYAVQHLEHVSPVQPLSDYRALAGNVQNIPIVAELSPYTVALSPSLRTEAQDDCAMPASSVRGRSIGYADILKWQKDLPLRCLMQQWRSLTLATALAREQHVTVKTAETTAVLANGVVGCNEGIGLLTDNDGRVSGSVYPWESEVVVKSEDTRVHGTAHNIAKLRNILLLYLEAKKEQLSDLGGVAAQDNDSAVDLVGVGVLKPEVEAWLDEVAVFDKAVQGKLQHAWNVDGVPIDSDTTLSLLQAPSEYPKGLLVDSFAPNVVESSIPSVNYSTPHAAVLASVVQKDSIVLGDNIVLPVAPEERVGLQETVLPKSSSLPSFTSLNAQAQVKQAHKKLKWLGNLHQAILKQTLKEGQAEVTKGALLTVPPSVVKSGQFYGKRNPDVPYYSGPSRGPTVARPIGDYVHDQSAMVVTQQDHAAIQTTTNAVFYNPDFIAGVVDVETTQLSQGELLAQDVLGKLRHVPHSPESTVTRALVHAFNSPTTTDKTVGNGVVLDPVGPTHAQKKTVDLLLRSYLALNYRHALQPYRKQLGLFSVQELRALFTPEQIKSFGEVLKSMQNSTRNFIRKQCTFMKDDPLCQFVQVPTSNIHAFASSASSDLLVLRAIDNAVAKRSTDTAPSNRTICDFPASRPFYVAPEIPEDTSGYPSVPTAVDCKEQSDLKHKLSERIKQVQDNVSMLNVMLLYKDREMLPAVDWTKTNKIQSSTKKAMFAHHHQEQPIKLRSSNSTFIDDTLISANTEKRSFKDIAKSKQQQAAKQDVTKNMKGDLTFGKDALSESEQALFAQFEQEVTDEEVMKKVHRNEAGLKKRGRRVKKEMTSKVENITVTSTKAEPKSDAAQVDLSSIDLDAYQDGLLQSTDILGTSVDETTVQLPVQEDELSVSSHVAGKYGEHGVVHPSSQRLYSEEYDRTIAATLASRITETTADDIDRKQAQLLHGKQYSSLRKILSVRESVPLLYSFGVHNDAFHTFGSAGYTEPAPVKHQISLPSSFSDVSAFASPVFPAQDTPDKELQHVYQHNAAKVYKSNLENVAQYIVSQVHLSQQEYWTNFCSQQMRSTQEQIIADCSVTSATYLPHNVLFTHDGPVVETLAEFLDFAVQMHNRDNLFNWYDKETTPDEWMVPSRTMLQHTQPVAHPFITAKHQF